MMTCRPDIRVLLVTLLLSLTIVDVSRIGVAHAAGMTQKSSAERVGEAIVRSVVQRIGGDPRVTVSLLHTGYTGDQSLTASPEPGARIGAPARFVLYEQKKRVGTAVATVDVVTQHVRAHRALARREAFAAPDVVLREGPLAGELIRRVPQLVDVIGARARRNIAEGEPITASVIEVPPLVRSGDTVAVIVRVGAVEVEGRGVASGSGHEGDVIRVTTAGAARPRSARIIDARTVEVIP